MKEVEINEWVEYFENIPNPNPYPTGGSTGIYAIRLAEVMLTLTGSECKLLMVLIAGSNHYNQVLRSREELANVLGIKYDPKRMYLMISHLVEKEVIAMLGDTITLNPKLVLPTIRSPKLKAAMQQAWEDMVEFV